jgi:hypothetical protein
MEDGIKIDLQDAERGVEWTDLFQNGDNWPSLVHTVMKAQFAQNAKNSLTR